MTRARVFVTRAVAAEELRRLEELAEVDVWPEARSPSREELALAAGDADGLITMLTDRIDAALLEVCPRLKVVANVAVGTDNLDLAALTARKIPAGNTPGVLTDATAEIAFALILATARRIVEARDTLLAGGWKQWEPDFLLGRELAGSTLGIVGLGRIGLAVARRAQAFSMSLLATSRRGTEVPGVTVLGLDALLAQSDIVSLHVPLSDATRHLIGRAELARMKPGSILINTARGAVVDEEALADALESGHLGAAGLDVFSREPVRSDDRLVRLPNCVALPHIGSATGKTRRAMAGLAVDNVLAALRGERLPNCANPEVYEPSGVLPG